MVKFAVLKNWRWQPILDKHERGGSTGTPVLSLLRNLISAQLIAADKRETLDPWTAETLTKEAGRLLSKNMAVDLSIQGKKSPQKMAPRSNFWGLCRICGTFFRAFLAALFQLPGLEEGLDALTR